MISLVQLLEELSSRPKAIMLAGAPGAGKSSLVDDYIKDFNLKVLNIDDYYKENLKNAGVSYDLKNAGKESRSKAATAMQQAIKTYNSALNQAIENKENIVLDNASGSLKNVAELKNQLMLAGYDVLMVYVHASLKKALKRNEKRFDKSQGQERSLPPDIVLKTWTNVTRNYTKYRDIFGDNFISTVNDNKPFTLSSYEDIKKSYVDPFAPKDSTTKSAKDQAYEDKIDAENKAFIENWNAKMKSQNIIDNSVSKKEVNTKIKDFLQS